MKLSAYLSGNRKYLIILVSASLLTVLWGYSAGKQLYDFNLFKGGLSDQVFSRSFTLFLIYFIPAGQIISALLLVSKKTRLTGFALSLLLLVLFTGYIGLILVGYFVKIPCSCISIISGMEFKGQFYFNLFFVAVAIIGFILTLKKERRNKGMDASVSHAPLTALE